MPSRWKDTLEWLFLRSFLGVPLLFVLLHLYGLDRAKGPWYDDVMYAAPAHYLVSEGRPAYGHEPGVAHLDEIALRAPPVGTWVAATWFWLVGFSAYRNSLLYLLCGAGALLLFAHWLRRLLSHWHERPELVPWLVLLTTLLLACDRLFAWTIRAGRPESLALLFGCGALLLSCRPRSGLPLTWRRMFAVGLLGGLGMNVHPLLVLLGPAVLLQWFFFHEPPRDSRKSLAAFALGGVLAFVPLAVLASSHWEVFRLQFLGNLAHHTRGISLTDMIQDELRLRWVLVYMVQPIHLLAMVVFGVSGLAAFARGERRASVAVAAALAVLVLLFRVRKGLHVYYLAYALPLVYGAVAWGLVSWRERIDGHRQAGLILKLGKLVLLLGLLNGLLVSNVAFLGAAWATREARSQDRLEQALRERIPPGSIVVGPVWAWFAARRCGYTYYLSALHSHVGDLERNRLRYERRLHADPDLQYFLAPSFEGKLLRTRTNNQLPFPAVRLGRSWTIGNSYIGLEGPLFEWFFFSGGYRLGISDVPLEFRVYEVLPPKSSPR